jgi:hypothetical protein
MLSLFKKRKGEKKMASTLEEVRKAYEDLSDDDKKTFTQSISDRVHESIAAQEKDKGETDTQSAEDREHEALGEEHADEERAEEEGGEEAAEDDGEEAVEEHEEKEEGTLGKILERLGNIEAKLASLEKDGKDVEKASDPEKAKLDKLASIYNN